MPDRKIMIVDDLKEMRNMIHLMLRDWTVIDAENGEQAVELARTERPDVILMDYNMPFMNGIDACRIIKTDPETEEIPVLIYTGAYAQDLQDRAYEAGAATFLTKPILPNTLRAAIEQAYVG
jgi:CheY-like chemotaxis protein